tara:strand:+ start:149 stop:412 length:264 start_codon:yes stop_codon:yes gene_type:complete
MTPEMKYVDVLLENILYPLVEMIIYHHVLIVHLENILMLLVQIQSTCVRTVQKVNGPDLLVVVEVMGQIVGQKVLKLVVRVHSIWMV